MKVTEIERLLERSDISIVEEATGKILATENMCISIYNDLGVRTYIGENPNIPCQLNNLKNSTMKEYMIMADNASTHDFSINFNNGIHEQGMYFYGEKYTHKWETELHFCYFSDKTFRFNGICFKKTIWIANDL
ncbi:hypothetical protein [Erysipelothrix piscisicarius]|uniref:hypothetical protein n=1 Tax=Erysipelothrix piscisicarius TaxID=2485784 RepID=UPI002F95660F